MSKLIDNLRKIVRTKELDEKIKPGINVGDKRSILGGRGEALQDPAAAGDKYTDCPLYYITRENSYDIADLLAGTAGPTLVEPCAILTTVTGITDLDVSPSDAYLNANVHLIVQLDGVIK